ncbi:MAG TPA: hypothetical protein PK335_02770 [Draconibacterium sp.]|nr:hypothetical protein [Draconibacterium sp.]
MDYQEKLRGKYFKGETTLEEEKELRKLLVEDSSLEAEADMFLFFESEGNIPGDLEESLMKSLERRRQSSGRIRHLRRYSIASAAAIIILILSIYIDSRYQRKVKMENDFFVMENALFQVSQSLQPEEQKEMMILWVDEDVEVIIN